MPALYITANEPLAGKTALCIGLGIKLRGADKAVGYLKPVSIAGSAEEAASPDGDIAFAAEVLGLREAPDALGVFRGAEEQARAALAGQEFAQGLKQAYQRVAAGKDVVLVEGVTGFSETAAVAARAVVQPLDAGVLAIIRYSKGREKDDIQAAQMLYGGRLRGVVFNKVSSRMRESLEEDVAPYAERIGVKVLGYIEEDRALATISLGELVSGLGGRYVGERRADETLVERVIVGGASIHAGHQYFGRFPEKMALIAAEKADIQLAALQTPLQCLIVTGKREPMAHVLFKAEEKGVPVVRLEEGTHAVMERIGEPFAGARFRQRAKVERMAALLERHVDVGGVV